MLNACAERFDVTKNLKNFLVFGLTKQGLSRVYTIAKSRAKAT